MARAIPATPALSGEDARALLMEVLRGSPNSAERCRTLREARANYARHRHAFERQRSSRQQRD